MNEKRIYTEKQVTEKLSLVKYARLPVFSDLHFLVKKQNRKFCPYVPPGHRT